MIQSERIEALNSLPPREGGYVLYWMQQAQRTEYNHALEYAVEQANERGLPTVVCFGLTDDYPEANARHYAFMLEGLRDVAAALKKRGIAFVLRKGSPDQVCIDLAEDSALVVVDAGYLSVQRQWRRNAAKTIEAPLFQVETDVVVPIEIASVKEEYAARTIRPKIHKQLDTYLVSLRKRRVKQKADALELDTLDPSDRSALLKLLDIDRSVSPSDIFKGGEKEASKRLRIFLTEVLHHYDEARNDPSLGQVSHMSPYLHFGQISPLAVALQVRDADVPKHAKEAYLEELIVRRELSMNFVYFNKNYDSYKSIPDWAKRTLRNHAKDKRPYLYTREQWEAGQTHDPYWNAAQLEMVETGKMHNYMRMYWGKKIIEWSKTPDEAFDTALYLNNKYELDGRDANSFTGVAWCFGKHDRPWTERPIFGQVRYMNANGLKRKFKIDDYVKQVEEMTGRGLLSNPKS